MIKRGERKNSGYRCKSGFSLLLLYVVFQTFGCRAKTNDEISALTFDSSSSFYSNQNQCENMASSDSLFNYEGKKSVTLISKAMQTFGNTTEGKLTGMSSGPLTAERARALMSNAQSGLAEIVDILRKMIDMRIEEAAAANQGAIVFAVPHSVEFYGQYDVNVVGRLLAENLGRSGFCVYGTPEGFKIAWSRAEILASKPAEIKVQTTKALRERRQTLDGLIVPEQGQTLNRIVLPAPRETTIVEPNPSNYSLGGGGGVRITIPKIRKGKDWM